MQKYRNHPNVVGFGLEVLGGMSTKMKQLFQIIAANLEARTDTACSVWMYRIRSQYYGHLMLQNALMIQRAGLTCNHFDFDHSIQLIDW